MADNLNIKNPSVTVDVLDLRTDSSGNIVSISGHSIAGGAGGGNVYFGDDEYIQFKSGTTNTFTLTDNVKDVIDHIPQTVETEVNRISYTKTVIDDKLDDKQDKLTFEYDEENKVSAINGSALAGQGGTTYTPGQYINIDSNNEISVTGLVAIDEYATYSGDWNDVSNSYKTNSGSFITKDVNNLTNYYPKTQTSSDSELAEAFGSILKYNVTAAAGIQVTTATDAGVKTYGISMTAEPVVTDTRLSGYNGVAAALDTNVSGLWNVGLTQDMLNTINGKLDTTAAEQTYLEKSTYTNASGKWENASNVVVTNSANWNAKADQAALDDYLTKAQYGTDSATFALKNDLYDYYPKTDTSSNIELSDEFEKYIQTISTGVGLTGDGKTTPLGIDTAASINLTNASAKSAISADKAASASASKRLQSSTSGPVIQAEDVTALQHWASSNSSTWNEVSAKLTTAQYATDSATFVTSSISTITGTKQYALTTAGWAEVQAGTSFTGVTTTGSISGGGVNNDTIGLLTSAENALSDVANKVDKPSSLVDKYLVLRTNDAGNVSGWCDLQDQSYSKSEALDTFVATANIDTTTLSGNGKSSSTKLGVKTDVIATRDYVNSSFLPLSGGTVSGDVIIYSSGTNLLTINTTATLMGQSRVANLTDTTAIGTNWLGVNSNGGGFLKNVQGGNVGALNGTSIQINFAPDGANSYGNITVNSQGNESKIVNVPTASYNSMSSFDNTNGPNYMLRKTASGFDIGAAVINVQSLPATTEANAYYFVYDA